MKHRHETITEHIKLARTTDSAFLAVDGQAQSVLEKQIDTVSHSTGCRFAPQIAEFVGYGLRKDLVTHPQSYASYAISIRPYRLL